MEPWELWVSFAITWIVVLLPPIAIRALRRRPWSKALAITFCVVLFFINVVVFTALGSTSKSHGALLIGAFFSYYIFRWQTNASAEKIVREQRKKLGYDQ